MNKKLLLTITGIVLLSALMGAACDISGNSGDKNAPVQNNQTVNEPITATPQSTGDVNYFDDNAKVMLFYSDYCGWCVKQKDVLSELGAEGYKVKSMDVGKNQGLWQEYQISGTPTFIAPDGTKLVGFQQKDALKAFLDKYK